MERIIKSSDVDGGNVTPAQFEGMRQYNLAPEFDASDKSWNFHRVLATDTKSTPWLISIEGEYFVAIQSPPAARGSHQVTFYPSTEKGKYKISLKTMVKRLTGYIDLEAACDEFATFIYDEKTA